MKKIHLAISIILMLSLTLTFNASAQPPPPPISPDTGDAGSFAILAGTAITNVPLSDITGNVGLSPAAGSNYAGLSALEVLGTIYAADATGPAGSIVDPGLLTTAKLAVSNTFDALDQGCTITYAGVKDLTEVSPLGPGVYCADAFLLTGNLTLSGSGIWIFKSAATLSTSSGSTVTGGDPCNVWWRLVSDGALGTNSSFIGTILAGTTIAINTGATLNGRAWAQAAVTLDQNTITNPICRVLPDLTATSAAATATANAAATATAQAAATATAETAARSAGTATTNAPEEEEDTPTSTATLLPVMTALPGTGGAPIRSDNLPWALVVVVAGLGTVLLIFGVRAYRSTDRRKQ